MNVSTINLVAYWAGAKPIPPAPLHPVTRKAPSYPHIVLPIFPFEQSGSAIAMSCG